MRGVALAVAPAMVGAFAISGLTTPSKLVAKAPMVTFSAIDRIKPVDRLQILDGISVSIPGLPPDITLGATVKELAGKAGVDEQTLRWANDIPDNQEPAPGLVLSIPPTRGSLMWRNPGENLQQFASRANISMAVLTEFNNHSGNESRRYLQVPLGTAGATVASNQVSMAEPGLPRVASSQRNHGTNHFPFGQCTWFVASKRDVGWNGDAGMWLIAARGRRPEGHTPMVGAIAVQTGGYGVSSVGHVSYVEAVNPDGSFQIAEMNHSGWGQTDQRTMRPGKDGVAGFIY